MFGIPKVSIIVPVYNVENYISKCIESILIQTFTDLELILVDDGSLDSSGIICDKYALLDKRIKVIHQQNSGATVARLTGVNLAKGEFICFVDSDDTLPEDSIETLYSYISPDIDIVIGKIYDEERFPISNTKDLYIVYNIDFYRKIQLEQVLPYQSGPVAKLFRQNLFNEYVFEIPRDILVGEDWLMNIRLSFEASKNVCFVNKRVYNYNRITTSVTHTFQKDLNFEDIFYKYYMESIPIKEKNRFIEITIKKRLSTYIWYAKKLVKVPKDSYLYTTLYIDIKETKYKLTRKEWALFFINSPLLRYFMIKVYNMFTKK